MARLGRGHPARAYVVTVRPRFADAVTVVNDFDGGGAGGATLTGLNAGGSGDTQFDGVTIGSGATLTLDSTHAHTGSLAVKCNVGSTPADAGFEWSTAVGTQSTWYTRIYYYATSNPATHHRIFDATTAGGAALCTGVQHRSDGTLLVLTGGFGIAAQTTATIALNQWVRIETKFVGAPGTGGAVELRFYNSADSGTPTETVSASGIDTSGPGVIYRFGFNGDSYDTGRTVWLDDVGVSTADWLGPLVVNDITPTAGAATGTGAAFDATVAIGPAAETANAYASRFTDGFAGISTAPVWADDVVHGQWYQTPSGNQSVGIVEQGGTKYLRVSAEPIGGGGGTLAGLALSRDNFSNWSTLAFEYITDTQWRTPTPNTWELGWVFFNFTDSNHFYYVILYPDGNFELGKEWTDGVTQFQDFLATGTNSATYSLGDRMRVEIDQTTNGSTVTFNVRSKNVTRGDVSYQTLVTGFVDDGLRASGAAYLFGKLGLYVEDSAARFAVVELNSPHILDASPAVTVAPSTATAAGTAPDAAAAITFPAGAATATGAAHDAQAGVGPQPAAATGTGTAYDVASLTVTFGADTATATGTAPDAQAGVAPAAGLAAGTGTAYDVDHLDLTATASAATATGTAPDAAAALTIPAGAATGTGAAFDAAAAAGVLAEAAAAVGAALDAQVNSAGFTQTQTDTTGLTDSGVAQGRTATGVDTVGLTDSASTVLLVQHLRTVDDTAGLSDSSALAQAATVNDAAGLTDQAAASVVADRTQTDSAGLTDSAGAAAAFNRAITDGAGLTDAASPSVTATRTVDDPTGLTDAREVAVSATVTDAAGLTDGVGTAVAHARTVTDIAGLTDVGLVQGLGATGTDPAGLSDSVTAQLIGAILRTVTDAAGLTDVGDPLALDVGETVTDTAGLADTVSAQLSAAGTRTVDDGAGLTDSLALARAATQTDTAGLADSLGLARTATVTDAAGLSDSTSAQTATAGSRTIDDSAGLTDTLAFAATATVADSAGLTDSVVAALSMPRSITDSAGLTDAVTVELGKTATVTDSTGLTDSRATAVVFARTQDDPTGLVDTLALALVAVRTVDDLLGLIDTAVQGGVNARTQSDGAGLTDSVTATISSALNQTVTDTVGLASEHRAAMCTVRPFVGVTTRLFTGVTTRPFAGVTSRHPFVPD